MKNNYLFSLPNKNLITDIKTIARLLTQKVLPELHEHLVKIPNQLLNSSDQ